MSDDKKIKIKISWIYLLFQTITSMIGYHIHHSIFWSIIDWFFAPFAWLKWIIFEQVNITIIHQTFEWFFK